MSYGSLTRHILWYTNGIVTGPMYNHVSILDVPIFLIVVSHNKTYTLPQYLILMFVLGLIITCSTWSICKEYLQSHLILI